MGKANRKRKPLELMKNNRFAGRAQMTLVEHALCPLDAPNTAFAHEVEYFFYRNRKRQLGKATINCNEGLQADDELYLHGLLGIIFSQESPEVNFYSFPSYIIRELGYKSDNQDTIERLRNALRRLAGVRYQNKRFWDPYREEFREVAFGFLSYDLPSSNNSRRPWRISIDPVFFDFCKVSGCFTLYDRKLLLRIRRNASRRLFLLLNKLFYKTAKTGYFDVEHLCINQIGFAPGQPSAEYKRKLYSCVKDLAKEGLVVLPDSVKDLCQKDGVGKYSASFERGPEFGRIGSDSKHAATDGPMWDLMKSIPELNDGCRRKVLKSCSQERIYQWADATLMAMEKHGKSYFAKNEAAFFYEGVMSGRLPPNWYFDGKRDREKRESQETSAALTAMGIREAKTGSRIDRSEDAFQKWLRGEGQEQFRSTIQAMGDEGKALSYLRRRFQNERREPAMRAVGEIFKLQD